MKICVVIPVFNSEKIIEELILQLETNLSKLTDKYEIVLVNDCSNDGSWEKIKILSNKFSFLKGISLSKNHGQHNSIVAGLNFCEGDFFILMDDDLQHDPNSIDKIVNELVNGSDSCYVKYLKRKHVAWKKFVSYLNNISSSFLFGKSSNVYTSSFKGFNKKIKNFIINTADLEVFLDWPILENSKKISIVEVPHQNRFHGQTNYDLKKLLKLWSIMILNIKPKNKIKSFILFFLKFLINNFLLNLIIKKKLTKQFDISDKTF